MLYIVLRSPTSGASTAMWAHAECHLNSDASSGRVGVAGAGGSSGASSISDDSGRLPPGVTGLPAALTGLLLPTGLPPLSAGCAGGCAGGGAVPPSACGDAARPAGLSVEPGCAAAMLFAASPAAGCSGGSDMQGRAKRCQERASHEGALWLGTAGGEGECHILEIALLLLLHRRTTHERSAAYV